MKLLKYRRSNYINFICFISCEVVAFYHNNFAIFILQFALRNKSETFKDLTKIPDGT